MTSETVRLDLPHIITPLPGPRAKAIIERDRKVLSPSYTRDYPLVVDRGEGAVIEDVDGNRFLDFNAGIAVAATGHCHPQVVKAIERQAARLIHMSGTDFYYENMVELAEKLAATSPGAVPRRVYFGNSGAESSPAITLAATNSLPSQEHFMAALSARFHLPAARSFSAKDSVRWYQAFITHSIPIRIDYLREPRLNSTPSIVSRQLKNYSAPSCPLRKWLRLSSSRSRAKAAT